LLIADTGRISYRLSRMQAPSVFGIPLDFILFGLTLAGVAVFHKCTMRVALTGLVTIIIYKIAFTGFKTGEETTWQPR
jgi:hypothetical protein